MSGVLRVLIVDDARLARQELRTLLSALPWVQCVGEADDVPAAREAIAALAPDLVLLPDDPFPWKERDLRELQRRFPDAEVRRVDGRALAWNPGRSLEGLALLRKLRAGFPP